MACAQPRKEHRFALAFRFFVMFVVCLKMETPVERIVAFTVVPFAFIAITFWDRFLRSRTPRLFRPFATSAVPSGGTYIFCALPENVPFQANRSTARNRAHHRESFSEGHRDRGTIQTAMAKRIFLRTIRLHPISMRQDFSQANRLWLTLPLTQKHISQCVICRRGI